MKKPKLKVRKMNPFGHKYEQLTLIQADGRTSWFNCHVGEWKKGFVQFVPDVVYDIDHYRVIVGDNELVGQEHWVAKRDKAHWQKSFELSGFEVRYVKPGPKKSKETGKSVRAGEKKRALAKK